MSVKFASPSDQYLEADVLFSTAPFSMSMWVYPTNSRINGIMFYMGGGGSLSGWMVQHRSTALQFVIIQNH